MTTKERLIESIRHQPESTVREVWHYLEFLEQKHENEKRRIEETGRALREKLLDGWNSGPEILATEEHWEAEKALFLQSLSNEAIIRQPKGES